MTCKEAESLVMPYIKNELTDEELFEFLEHIEHCPECREELEIYFTVDVGIRQLDSETGNYNIKGALETAIEQSREDWKPFGSLRSCAMRYPHSALWH